MKRDLFRLAVSAVSMVVLIVASTIVIAVLTAIAAYISITAYSFIIINLFS